MLGDVNCDHHGITLQHTVHAQWAFLHRSTCVQTFEYPQLGLSSTTPLSIPGGGPHLHMSIAERTVPSEFTPASVISEKFDSYFQADVVDIRTVVHSNDAVILHLNQHSLRDKVKQKQFAFS